MDIPEFPGLPISQTADGDGEVTGEIKMAKAQSQPDEPDQEITKRVVVVGYVQDCETVGTRFWANEYDDKTNYFERKERSTTKTTRKLKGGPIDLDLSREEFEELANMEVGDFELVHKEEEVQKEEWVNDPDDAAEKFLDDISGDLRTHLLQLFPDWEDRFVWTDWVLCNEDGDTTFRIYSYVEKMPLLKHQQEMSEDDPYVDEDEELTVVKFKIRVKNVTREDLEVIDSEFIEPFVTDFGRNSEISRVRIVDCEQETKEKGVCVRV